MALRSVHRSSREFLCFALRQPCSNPVLRDVSLGRTARHLGPTKGSGFAAFLPTRPTRNYFHEGRSSFARPTGYNIHERKVNVGLVITPTLPMNRIHRSLVMLKSSKRQYSSGKVDGESNFFVRLLKDLFSHNKLILSRYWAELDPSIKSAVVQSAMNSAFFLVSGGVLYGYGVFKKAYDDMRGFFVSAAAERDKNQAELVALISQEHKRFKDEEGIRLTQLLMEFEIFKFLILLRPRKLDWKALSQMKADLYLDELLNLANGKAVDSNE